MSIRIIIAESDLELRSRMRSAINGQPDMEIVGEFERFEEVRTVMAAAGIQPLGQGK